MPHENSFGRFQCKSGGREYFQTKNWEWESTSGYYDNGVRIVNFATKKNDC